jgi:hypothetical protein
LQVLLLALQFCWQFVLLRYLLCGDAELRRKPGREDSHNTPLWPWAAMVVAASLWMWS